MAMSPQIELFCRRTIKRGLLTESHCSIVKEMISVEATLDEFVQTVLEFGVCRDTQAIDQLRQETMTTWNTMAPEDRLLVTNELLVTSENVQGAGDTLGLDWFCFFAITEGCLTKETCLAIAAEVEDLTDVLLFAQEVIERWTSSDYTKLQKCVDKAMTMLKTGKVMPPFRVFGRATNPVTPAGAPMPPPKLHGAKPAVHNT